MVNMTAQRSLERPAEIGKRCPSTQHFLQLQLATLIRRDAFRTAWLFGIMNTKNSTGTAEFMLGSRERWVRPGKIGMLHRRWVQIYRRRLITDRGG